MSKINDGGPAFPIPLTDEQEQRWNQSPGLGSANGMTLRDYFAAKAMQGAIGALITGAPADSTADAKLAKASYAIADAMLTARDKTTCNECGGNGAGEDHEED